MDNNFLAKRIEFEDEIDLVDLIKILFKNIKFIFIFTFFIFLFGFLYGLHMKKTEKLVFEQKFELELPKFGAVFSYSNIFDSDEIVNLFFENEIIKKIYKEYEEDDIDTKRKFLNKMFKVSSPVGGKLYYRITVAAENENEVKILIDFYYEKLSEYIDNFYKEEISEKYKKNIEQYNLYKDLYDKSQNDIKNLLGEGIKLDNSVNSIYVVQALKELNTKLFSEKDTYASLYKSSLNEKLNLEQIISQMGDCIKVRSSLYKLDSKIKLRLIAVISCFLGFFLSIFLVFLKEFIKNIDWKD